MTAPKQAFASKPLLATPPRFVDNAEARSLQGDIRERIAQRAYELYQCSGHESGNDQRHWFQAESEVLQRTLTVRESGSWLAVNGHLPNVSGEDVQIFVDPRRIVVRAKKQTPPTTDSDVATSTEDFFVADLHVDVDPESATAALRDQKLSLMVKKSLLSRVAPLEFTRR
jgi:HSP20 family molecular chaperone IbpA